MTTKLVKGTKNKVWIEEEQTKWWQQLLRALILFYQNQNTKKINIF